MIHMISQDLFSQNSRNCHAAVKECGGSVEECLTQDRGAAGLRLTRGTALCP